MKIQCDVCEKAQATVICCADEAALCAQCDVEVHAANKLASKHQRLLLECLSTKLPPCDICQEKAAFIFCVEDRAMLCRDCDEPIHSANARAANHQRFLATGIRVALNASCSKETVNGPVEPPPAPKQTVKHACGKMPTMPVSNITSPSWAVDDLLQFSDYESSDKKEQLEFNEFEWLSDFGLFEQSAAEVPQMPAPQFSNPTTNKAARLQSPYKKPRIAMPEPDEDDEEFFTVPDLG